MNMSVRMIFSFDEAGRLIDYVVEEVHTVTIGHRGVRVLLAL